MNKKVFFVNVARKTNTIQLPISFAVLTNILMRNDINPEFIDLIPIDSEHRIEVFKTRISKEPAIYCFSIIAGNGHIDETEVYSKLLLEANPANTIVYGGPLPSSIPELILKNCSCHYVIAGEAEVSFPNFLRKLFSGDDDFEKIKGVYYKSNGTIKGSRSKWIRELDELSKPDYRLFDMDFYNGYLKETKQSFEVMASRGCRGNCSFCYKFCGKGLSVKNPDAVLDEIEEIMINYGFKSIYFVDENFLDVKKFFIEFIKRKIERKLDFEFIAQTRIDGIDEDICKLGIDNGLKCLTTGVESVSPKTLLKINKRITVEDVEDKIKLVNKFGIPLLVSFIIGFPWDTEDDFKSIIKFVEKNNLEKRFKVSYLTPLPQTAFLRYAVERKLIENEFEYIRNLGDLYWQRMINLTNMPDEVLDSYYVKLDALGQKDVVWPKSQKYLNKIRKIH